MNMVPPVTLGTHHFHHYAKMLEIILKSFKYVKKIHVSWREEGLVFKFLNSKLRLKMKKKK